jgi:hypothetical protein
MTPRKTLCPKLKGLSTKKQSNLKSTQGGTVNNDCAAFFYVKIREQEDFR